MMHVYNIHGCDDSEIDFRGFGFVMEKYENDSDAVLAAVLSCRWNKFKNFFGFFRIRIKICNLHIVFLINTKTLNKEMNCQHSSLKVSQPDH